MKFCCVEWWDDDLTSYQVQHSWLFNNDFYHCCLVERLYTEYAFAYFMHTDLVRSKEDISLASSSSRLEYDGCWDYGDEYDWLYQQHYSLNIVLFTSHWLLEHQTKKYFLCLTLCISVSLTQSPLIIQTRSDSETGTGMMVSVLSALVTLYHGSENIWSNIVLNSPWLV